MVARSEPNLYAAWRAAGEQFRFPEGESLLEQQRRTLAAIEEVENMIETGKGEHFEGSTDDFFAQLAAEG